MLQHPSLLAAHLASLAIRSLLLWSLPLAAAILRIGSCLATLWSRGTGRCIPFTTGHGERRLKDRARQRARSVIVNQVGDGRRRTCIYIYIPRCFSKPSRQRQRRSSRGTKRIRYPIIFWSADVANADPIATRGLLCCLGTIFLQSLGGLEGSTVLWELDFIGSAPLYSLSVGWMKFMLVVACLGETDDRRSTSGTLL
jgi:hypothetical protein